MMIIIEDLVHAEQQGQYSTLSEAFSELRHLAEMPWDREPNRCPCTSWQTCNREYEIIEYDTSFNPWKEMRRFGTLKVSRKGVVWSGDFKAGHLLERNV